MDAHSQPNIVLIFTDNQQASTLGCYGNSEIHTPHLDALAGESMVFDNAFCPNAFCSPCRASLLTGQMPSQHGIHSWLDDRRAGEWPGGWHALSGQKTLPEQLSSKGYTTALIGKYHLGQPTTPMPGFDHWVTMEDGHVRSFYRNQITENGNSYFHEGHSADFFTEKALDFIQAQEGSGRPFFLYLPYPAPYGHWPATKETDRCRHSARYDDCPINSIPRRGLSKAAVDGFLMRNKHSSAGLDFSMLMRAPNDLGTLRNYYAQISMVDEGVGRVVAELDRLGMGDDTLVIFTADHGLSMGHHGFWGHGAATMPSNMHHAAHSVPLIVRHRKSIEPGVRSNAMVSNMDLYATVLEFTGGGTSTVEDSPLPSRSLAPILKGNAACHDEDAIYSEQEETRTIRTSKWTYFKRFAGDGVEPFGDELYDVEADPEESINLIDKPEFAAVQADLDTRLQAHFEVYSRPEADLWSAGRPVQNSARVELWRQAWGEDWAPVFNLEGL
ncbi:MAG: sulfatase-like hydrolase/transferase [Rhizobiaceae bacterium]